MKLQTSLTKPIPFFYKKDWGYDPVKNVELPKPKYYLKKHKTHVLIITEPHSELPKYHVFRLPIKHVLHVSTKLLKILFKENLITQRQVQLAYNQWVQEESEIIMIKTNHKDQLAERVKMPVRRRGNEHYHKHTWSRLQWYQLIFDSIPHLYKNTKKKTKKQNGKKRTIHKFNTLLLSLTYPKTDNLGEAWQRTSGDINRFFTNLKGRLRRRNIKIQFYFKALESMKSGMPHAHILIRLSEPIECYGIPTRKGTYYRPFKKELFKWKYGFYDVRGIVQSTNVMSYITKYITKQTKPEHALKSKTLALSWMSNKRLYSNTMFDLFKWKFPNLASKMKLTEKFTVNKAVDKLWDGLEFPKVNWNHISNETKAKLGFKARGLIDLHAGDTLKEPLPSRLNCEGFYRVTTLVVTKPDGEVAAIPLERASRRLLEYQRTKRTKLKRVLT